MNSNKVLTTIDQRGIATVTLNNPDKHNAFDDHLIQQLIEAFETIAANSDVRALLLRSNGKSFSSGADLAWMKRMVGYSYEQNLQDANALAQMLKTLNFMPHPTIARVQGAAFGGAVGLISCCDIAVASSNASFSLSEVKLGLLPATISPYVVAALGQRACRRYFMTAERFNADTAKQLGLVSEVVEEQALDEQIESFISALLSNSPVAVCAAKQLIFDVAGQAVTEKLIADTSRRIAAIRVSDEAQEGLSAFLEKRKPAWSQSSK